MNSGATQLTFGNCGHTIHNYQVFSPDDKWIVFDGRNYDNQISSNGNIGMVNVISGEIVSLYRTVNQTEYGPGVGAASFSPREDRVIFIHGIRNSSEKNPYGFTRRTGVAVDLEHRLRPVFMDARDIYTPFTPGALRGGTHAHCWSGDGKWISFTYNDYIMEQLGKTDNSIRDLRTVGIMVPSGKVKVSDHNNLENNDGELFSVVIAKVTENPKPGSDEIMKAFDECWIGKNGYNKTDGSTQEKAVAFQGHVVTESGMVKTECFVADLPGDVSSPGIDSPLEGTSITRPGVPEGVHQRRITYTDNGMEGPRHWLRTTPDGSLIAFLMKDKAGVVQVYGVSPNGGKVIQLTFNRFSVHGQFNFSPDGEYFAYPAGNSIFLQKIYSEKAERITPEFIDSEKPAGGAVWSNNGKMIAYNRYVNDTNGSHIQVFLLNV